VAVTKGVKAQIWVHGHREKENDLRERNFVGNNRRIPTLSPQMNREFRCRPLNSKAWLPFVKLFEIFGEKNNSVTRFRSSTLASLPVLFLKGTLRLIQSRTFDAVYPNVSNWPRPKIKHFTTSCNGQIRYSYM